MNTIDSQAMPLDIIPRERVWRIEVPDAVLRYRRLSGEFASAASASRSIERRSLVGARLALCDTMHPMGFPEFETTTQ